MLSNRDNTWKDFSHDTDVQYFIGDRDIPDFLEHLTDGKFRVGVNAPDIPTGVLLKARYGRQEASVKVTLLPEHPIDRIEILCSGEYVERERIEPLVLAYPTDGSAPRDITKKCSMVFDLSLIHI